MGTLCMAKPLLKANLWTGELGRALCNGAYIIDQNINTHNRFGCVLCNGAYIIHQNKHTVSHNNDYFT